MKLQIPSIPLVFLHGFLGCSQDWNAIFSFLKSENCLAIDLPGHANKPFTPDFTSQIPDFPKIHLIGYSMGGRIAMQFAEKFPKKIETLTLLSSHVGLQKPQEKQKRILKDLSWAHKITQNFDDFLKEWYDQPIFSGSTPDLTMRKKHDPKELSQSLISHSLGKQKVLHPKNALFLVGEKDIKYRKLYPNVVVIPEAGHMIHLENPEKVAIEIKKRVGL